MSWFNKTEEEYWKGRTETAERQRYSMWITGLHYRDAVLAQQKGLARLSRKIHRLRQLCIKNNINPDNSGTGKQQDD